MTLENSIRTLITSTLTRAVGLSSVSAVVAQNSTHTLTGANALFSAAGVISSGSVSYDLRGTLTDPTGQTVTFAKVQLLLVKNTSQNAMTIGDANNIPLLNGSTNKINLAAGATLLVIDPVGINVTASTADLITINGTNNDTFELLVIGISA